jgi:hypothetical protein
MCVLTKGVARHLQRSRLSAAMFKNADVLKLVVSPPHTSSARIKSISNTLQSCQPTQSECTFCLQGLCLACSSFSGSNLECSVVCCYRTLRKSKYASSLLYIRSSAAACCTAGTRHLNLSFSYLLLLHCVCCSGCCRKGLVLTLLKIFSVVTVIILLGVIIAQALIIWLVKDLGNAAIAIRAYTIGLALSEFEFH